jgi:cathepsin D
LAIATAVTQGLLDTNVDGIMGFGFKSLSTSGSTPFWQASGADEFAFYLRSDADSANSTTSPMTNNKRANEDQYGGVFTLGGSNSSLYTGDINYSNVVDETYWLITLGGLTINGESVSLESTSKTAVDTGTTLIGAPTNVVEAIYAQIPGSSVLADGSGYYQFPCSSTVNATMHFGDQEYLLDTSQFIAGRVDTRGQSCLGAFFSIGSDENDELQYILGDAFLTNVYTIFSNTASTPQVGFASLAAGLGTTTSSSTTDKVVAANGATLTSYASISTLIILSIGCVVAVL